MALGDLSNPSQDAGKHAILTVLPWKTKAFVSLCGVLFIWGKGKEKQQRAEQGLALRGALFICPGGASSALWAGDVLPAEQVHEGLCPRAGVSSGGRTAAGGRSHQVWWGRAAEGQPYE